MGTHLADSIEEFANEAHSVLVPWRKSRVVDLIAKWEALQHLVPQEARADEVTATLTALPFSPKLCLEAISRYALWFEGYSFGR